MKGVKLLYFLCGFSILYSDVLQLITDFISKNSNSHQKAWRVLKVAFFFPVLGKVLPRDLSPLKSALVEGVWDRVKSRLVPAVSGGTSQLGNFETASLWRNLKFYNYLLMRIFLFLLFISCGSISKELYKPDNPKFIRIIKRSYKPGDPMVKVIKVHMKNGELYVLTQWKVDDGVIKSLGTYYSVDRKTKSSGEFLIPIDSISIIEANFVPHDPRELAIIALTIPLIVQLGVTAFCFANPNACFGSCPTIYVEEGDSMKLKAEAFSLSVAPPLETVDIDMLNGVGPKNGEISLEVRNEALETHVIRYADLLIVPREGKRVFVTEEGTFYRANNLVSPIRVKCPEAKEKCNRILEMDGEEWFSLADDRYLGAKEEMELEFEVKKGNYGLILGRRQTLLQTFLFYQGLAYAGENIGYIITRLQMDKGSLNKLLKLLDIIRVKVYVDKGKGWEYVGEIEGEGPLALDYTLLPIGEVNDGKIRLKLVMTKGALRLDYVGLAEISEEVKPITVKPHSVLRDGKENDSALKILLDEMEYLVTLPGDIYVLKYKIPDGDYEVFLKAKGYYLEWMREDWIKEENLLLFWEMILKPDVALRRLAPVYKSMEKEMEYIFWRSKYAKP